MKRKFCRAGAAGVLLRFFGNRGDFYTKFVRPALAIAARAYYNLSLKISIIFVKKEGPVYEPVA
jgi:hypothetical protein